MWNFPRCFDRDSTVRSPRPLLEPSLPVPYQAQVTAQSTICIMVFASEVVRVGEQFNLCHSIRDVQVDHVQCPTLPRIFVTVDQFVAFGSGFRHKSRAPAAWRVRWAADSRQLLQYLPLPRLLPNLACSHQRRETQRARSNVSSVTM